MFPLALLPLPACVDFQRLDEAENQFLLHIIANCSSSQCPECGQLSSSRHSSYIRKLLDLPWAGIPVKVILSVSKYYCKNDDCVRKIFTERFGKKLAPYARRTLRLTAHLTEIGYALGGNGGSSLACVLGILISSSTILRILRNEPIDNEVATPRVLGIDDWAFRKGISYGTILVDLEKRRPIDLLPDREMETVKKWLEAHPGIEIISRDRASCYSKAAELGAPDAVQVADRWHLLKNLGDALKRMLDRHNQELRLAAKDVAQAQMQEQNTFSESQEVELKELEVIDEPLIEKESISQRELIFLEVKRLKAEGHSIRSIFRQTGLHRQTIKKYLKYDQYPQRAISPSRASVALPFESYLRKRWQEGQTNHKELWREIKEQGFDGSSQSVYRLVSKYPKDPKQKKLPPPLKIQTWSTRKVSLLLSQPFEKLDEETQEFLRAFYKRCPEANQASQLARKFKEMTDKLRKKKLDPWINKAMESGIPAMKNFAKGLLADYDAVKAAVSLKWSNGQVEGQVNRLKNIKRQMYGRAGFELLKRRVLRESG